MRNRLRTLKQPCAQLGFSEVAPGLEPNGNPPLLRYRSTAWAEPNVSSLASSSSLVLEPARSERVKQARRMTQALGPIREADITHF